MLPIILKTNWFTLYTYPLFWGIAWGIAVFEVHSQLQNLNNHFYKNLAWICGLFASSWIGAKLLFLLTSDTTSRLITDKMFWMGGGLVFYGGLILSILYVLAFGLAYKEYNVEKMNFIFPILLLSHSIGRIGCFLTGCCFGMESDCWLSINLNGVDRIPTQLIESIYLLILLIIIKKIKNKSLYLPYYFFFYGSFRFIIEYFRGDTIRGVWAGITPSQWISILLIFLSFFIFIKASFRNQREHVKF